MQELLRHPIVGAPLGGGPSTPALAAAVSEAGGLGFLAAGYKTAAAVTGEIGAVRALTAEPFGVHYVTAPIRATARERGDAEAINLWAGQAYELAREEPAGELVERWAAEVAGITRAPRTTGVGPRP